MHELSLCGAIIDTVEEHAGGRPVRCVRLRIGHFRQVVPEAMGHAWALRTSGSTLDGSVLEIDHVAPVIDCRACGASTTLDQPRLRCGACGGREVTLVSGDEFLVESIDVEPAGVDGVVV